MKNNYAIIFKQDFAPKSRQTNGKIRSLPKLVKFIRARVARTAPSWSVATKRIEYSKKCILAFHAQLDRMAD